MFFNFGRLSCKLSAIEKIGTYVKHLKIKENKNERNLYPQISLFEKIRRTSSCFFLTGHNFPKNTTKASMTVEAALVMPLFMFAMLNLNSFMELYETNIENNVRLYEEIRTEASMANIVGEIGFDIDDDITRIKMYGGKPAISIMGFDSFMMGSKYVAKPWTGYAVKNEGENSEDGEETVFITPDGEAYHVSDTCPYLKLSIHTVRKSAVSDERNVNGERYNPCPKCGGKDTGNVYITDYGNLYHTSLECSHLKRTNIEVPKSQVEGRHACPKCYGG